MTAFFREKRRHLESRMEQQEGKLEAQRQVMEAQRQEMAAKLEVQRQGHYEAKLGQQRGATEEQGAGEGDKRRWQLTVSCKVPGHRRHHHRSSSTSTSREVLMCSYRRRFWLLGFECIRILQQKPLQAVCLARKTQTDRCIAGPRGESCGESSCCDIRLR